MAVMKILKQILFILVLMGGMSLGVSAQKGGGQRPPKEQPKIEPKPKQTPKGDQRPKKPGYAFVIALPENTHLAE
jgi:hypothetical protein